MLTDLKVFHAALEQLEQERGISRGKIIDAIELAMAAAYKKDYGKKDQIIRARFDPESGQVCFEQVKQVLDDSMIKSEEEIEEEARIRDLERASAESGPRAKESRESEPEEVADDEKIAKKVRFNPERHIMVDEAKKIKKDIKVDEELVFPLEVKDDYGRIAAQTAKQVIIQRIREAERESIFDEFKFREGEIVSGVVQRIEGGNVFLDMGRVTAILPRDEQVRGERYRTGERIKALLFLVEKTPRGTNIYLSRSHPRFLAKLFEIEVPEIANGSVEIKSIAREPGSRSKIAMASKEEGIDPVGSCVGQKGVRVNTIINELGGEKVDIIEWSEDSATFIAQSVSPARVLDVEINDKTHEAQLTVAEDQLSLAIGRGGQNVRLAAKLTGWRIDIMSKAGESMAVANEAGEVSGVKEENPKF